MVIYTWFCPIRAVQVEKVQVAPKTAGGKFLVTCVIVYEWYTTTKSFGSNTFEEFVRFVIV